MSVAELQNAIIKELLGISDKETLLLLKEMLSQQNSGTTYKVSGFERNFIAESVQDYKKGNVLSNDEVFKKNERWLNE